MEEIFVVASSSSIVGSFNCPDRVIRGHFVLAGTLDKFLSIRRNKTDKSPVAGTCSSRSMALVFTGLDGICALAQETAER